MEESKINKCSGKFSSVHCVRYNNGGCMDRNEVVIVIPMYKNDLEWYEKLALKRVVTVLAEYPIVVCCPNNFNFKPIEEYYGIKRTEKFANLYFKSIDSYNKLVMSCEFYERFIDYQYMLIYQLDAFVFSDKLEYFCSLGYDYIGAPWIQPVGICRFKNKVYHLKVGNGGLSLRRVKACIEVLKDNSDILNEWHENEDLFFAYCGYATPKKFSIAPVNVAIKFSFESSVRKVYKKNNYDIPLGCHAWMKYGGEIYPLLFKNAGVDIDKYQDLMGYEDSKYIISQFKHRLCVSILRMKSFSNILPDNSCWSIICFGKIGKRLAEVFLSDGITINAVYDSNFSENHMEWKGIKLFRLASIDDLINEKGKIIIANLNHEKELIEMFEQNGLVYGSDFFSLCREYAKTFNGLCYYKRLYS